jgi:hypothetical protein
MSNLEKLPVELLEKVFLSCMNLELPRSSPVIAGKLSSDIVYLHTILAAFSPTWDTWHARGGLQWVEPGEDDGITCIFDGDHKLQVSGIKWLVNH